MPPPRPRLAQQVLEDLVSRIAAGDLTPGSTLPPEPELLAEYEVSRGVIREAVKLLEARGMVRIQHGTGTTISCELDWDLFDPLVLSATLANDSDQELQRELMSLRRNLEPHLAADAARHRTPPDIAVLDDILMRMRDLLDDADAYLRLDLDFHAAIMDMAGSRLVRQVVRTLHGQIRAEAQGVPDVPRDELLTTLHEHEAIRDAIAAGDPAAAHAATQHHIEDAWIRRTQILGAHAEGGSAS